MATQNLSSSYFSDIQFGSECVEDWADVDYGDWTIIAAIDFGTSNSGYAYAHVPKDQREPEIHLNEWSVLDGNAKTTAKAPTTLLLKNDQSLHSFGYDAEKKYAELCDKKEHKEYFYFRRFKMMLYDNKNIGQDNIQLEDENGNQMSAVHVFSIAITYLKQQLFQRLLRSTTNTNIDHLERHILWIITVPTIWSDAAKQFMEMAAGIAGIHVKQLKLVLEPEAAAMHCRYASLNFVEHENNITFQTLPKGYKYIMADIGGGTIDISTHEVQHDGQVLELFNAVGNDQGGTKFNSNFLKYLQSKFGVCFNKWKVGAKRKYLEMEKKIEGSKFSISDSDEDMLLPIPVSLKKLVAGREEMSLTDEDELLIENDTVRRFFDDTVNGITSELARIIRDVDNLQSVVLVGGIANSSYVQALIKDRFPDQEVIIPEQPQLSVLKGAVMLGWKPNIVAGRIARFSYGISLCTDFIEGKHPEALKFKRDGEDLCSKIFERMITKGTILKRKDTFSAQTTISAKQKETKKLQFSNTFYQTEEKDPKYATGDKFTKLGEIVEHPPPQGWPDKSESTVVITVEDSQFKFHVKDKTNGRSYETKVNYLFRDNVSVYRPV